MVVVGDGGGWVELHLYNFTPLHPGILGPSHLGSLAPWHLVTLVVVGERGSVFCHSSASLEGGCPSLAEVIEDTVDFIQLQGLL